MESENKNNTIQAMMCNGSSGFVIHKCILIPTRKRISEWKSLDILITTQNIKIFVFSNSLPRCQFAVVQYFNVVFHFTVDLDFF